MPSVRCACSGGRLPWLLGAAAFIIAIAALTYAIATNSRQAGGGRHRGRSCANSSTVPPNPVYSCLAPCFCTPSWKVSDVQNIDGLVYSAKYGLKLHLFFPPDSDKRNKRPAMVMIHGGSFKTGDRNGYQLVAMSKQLAARGYVTASIDYRLLNKGTTVHTKNTLVANTAATHDARAAVRWLRLHAEEYHIDPERIGAFGASAGGMTAAFMVTLPEDDAGDSCNPGQNSSISAAVSLSGVLMLQELGNVTATQPPYLDFHGSCDTTIKYNSSAAMISLMQSKGASADMYTFLRAGHVPWSDLATEHASASMLGFLAKYLDLKNAVCPNASAL